MPSSSPYKILLTKQERDELEQRVNKYTLSYFTVSRAKMIFLAKDTGQAAFSATGKFTSNLEFADREKKKAFVESIASGNFHNQADKGAESALSCVMARTAACTGRESPGKRP